MIWLAFLSDAVIPFNPKLNGLINKHKDTNAVRGMSSLDRKEHIPVQLPSLQCSLYIQIALVD